MPWSVIARRATRTSGGRRRAPTTRPAGYPPAQPRPLWRRHAHATRPTSGASCGATPPPTRRLTPAWRKPHSPPPSVSREPLGPDVGEQLGKHVDAARRYPDPAPAEAALAAALDVGAHRVLLTNGGAEAIALVARLLGGRPRTEPDFGLYPRDQEGRVWRSNPHNPSGRLAALGDHADVWDEAFYPLATGRWTSGDS